ncbi:MAG TPA: NADH-ubiquinone oxidoreductase-F iron-sulfur binding region domain-containing protein, partial [Planctomycetota bacterium]|nr:NADH-ubiquinone oxidoreductase-F iron-sulfur binding region domain-containing protein [Planctomycetota bacterium]
MDLHFTGARETPEERSAVDAAVGGEKRRDLLLPALHAINDRVGWISEGALDYVCRRLEVPPAEAFGVASFYHMFSLKQRPPELVYACDDIACRLKGAEKLCARLGDRVKRSPCLGQCERAPAALVLVAGKSPKAYTVAPFSGATAEPKENLRASVPQSGSPDLRLIHRIGTVDPESLEGYRSSGGYSGLRRAIELGPKSVIAEVTASKLVGRGGAAFPTGRKWEAVAAATAKPHYLVCNADESEPGTFKDRLLMEGDPFAVVEGMTIGGYATGCERGYLYVRGEYPLAARRMSRAIEAARTAGLLGAFDIEIRRGAGAYICGEETALFNSIEGRRGEPRNKPPFPVQVGLFGNPTVVNNVETLVNVPLILREGGASYQGGPKLFCVSGHVARPGLYEIPFGTTLRRLVEIAGGRKPQAVLLGGAAGSFVGPDQLDTPLTFEGTRAIGATLGSGVVMVMDDTVDLGDILTRIAAFFRDESCGQCVPCRVGTVRQEELLRRLRSGNPLGSRKQELALLKEIGQAMRDASICGLGQTASSAIESAVARWRIGG